MNLKMPVLQVSYVWAIKPKQFISCDAQSCYMSTEEGGRDLALCILFRHPENTSLDVHCFHMEL